MNNQNKLINKLLAQTGMLFFSQIALIVLGLAIKYVQTNELGDINYGEYALFISITSIALVIFRFGFYVSLQVLLANNKDRTKERELIGAGIIISFIVALCFALFLFAFSFWINDLLNTNIGFILKSLALLSMVMPFQFLISVISTGTNRIGPSALFNFLPKLIFLLALILFIGYFELDVYHTVLLNLCSTLLILIPILILFKPKFSNLKQRVTEIWKKNKSFGIHYYIGSVFNQTTYRLDEIFLAYFHNTVLVGYYSLANLVCSPMVLMSQSLSKSLFKRFAESDKIPGKVFLFNTAWLLLCIGVLGLMVTLLQHFQFVNFDYSEVIKYILPLSLAFFFQGMCSPYAFLAAKSKGKEIRNVAWMEAVINLLGNIILIPYLEIMGAIYSSISAKFVHFLALRFYYRKYLKENNIA